MQIKSNFRTEDWRRERQSLVSQSFSQYRLQSIHHIKVQRVVASGWVVVGRSEIVDKYLLKIVRLCSLSPEQLTFIATGPSWTSASANIGYLIRGIKLKKSTAERKAQPRGFFRKNDRIARHKNSSFDREIKSESFTSSSTAVHLFRPNCRSFKPQIIT